MPGYVVAILAGTLASYAAEREGIALRVEVVANQYTWTVRNTGAEPIMRFTVGVHHTYDHHPPDGWEMNDPGASGTLEAWTDDPGSAIGRSETAAFTVRVTSRGAILGSGPAKVALADGRWIEFPDAWRPVPESNRTVGVVIGTVLSLACLHVLVGRWRAHRRAGAVNHGPGHSGSGSAP